MSALLLSLLPLIIGCAVGGPAWIIMTLILLRSKAGVIKATAFAAGATTVRVLQYILFGYVFGEAVSKSSESAFDFVTSTLLLVAGVFLLITALKTWFKEYDPDAPPPKWMSALGGVSTPSRRLAWPCL